MVHDVIAAALCGVQVTVQGWVGPGSYLRERWTWIDVLVVVMGYLALVPGVSTLSGVRVFRVLRPLRTLTSLPALRLIVKCVRRSMSMGQPLGSFRV